MFAVEGQVAGPVRIADHHHTVLIVGDPPEREVTVPVANLSGGLREGHSLQIRLHGEQFLKAEINHEAAGGRRKRIRTTMRRLQARGRRSYPPAG